MIAMALAGEPDLVLMDEPTTGLDVIVQARLLDLIRDLKQRHGLAVLFVSHDLGAIAAIADQIGVLYAGELIEFGPARDVLDKSADPYTRALLMAIPRIDGRLPKGVAYAQTFLPAAAPRTSDRAPPLLRVTDLSVRYRQGRLWGLARSAVVQAVKRVSFSLEPEQALAIVGESGSGKTTV